MGILRIGIVGILALCFLAALGNAAYLALNDREVTAPFAPPPLPVASVSSAPSAPPPAPVPAPLPETVVRAAQDPLPGLVPAREAAAPVLSPARIAEIETVWRNWLQEAEISAGAMALALPDGRVVGTGTGRDIATTAPVASLSKAITGLCLDGLLAEHGLGWDTRLGDIAAQMSAAGLTPRPWNAHLTLGGLATHTSGLAPDMTQGDMLSRTHGALGLHRRIASEALAEGAMRGTPGEYFYSNTNYAVLGVVIEALSGRSYAATCMDRVLRPAGIEGAIIEGRMGSMSSYAGWEISAGDYARLARHWFTEGNAHVDMPQGRPAAGDYAIGYTLNGAGRDAQASHSGRLCLDREAREGHGALFVAEGTGVAFAANWANCIDMRHYRDLQARIAPLLR